MASKTEVLTEEQSAELQTSTTIVLAYDRAPLIRLNTEWASALAEWRAFECETLDDEDLVSEAVGVCQAKLKELDAQRKEVALPLDRELKEFNAYYKDICAPLAAFKDEMTKKLSVARAKRDEREREAKRLVAEAAASGDEDATFDALASVPERAKVAGTRTTYKWEFTVTNEAEIERDYLTFDPDLAKAFVTKAYGTKSSQTIIMRGFVARCIPTVSTNGRSK